MKENMTKGNPLSIILRFTIPLFIGNLFQQIYNTIDTMIVGQYLGKNALAAVGSTGTLMFMIIGLALGHCICTGFTVLTSQKFGEGNESETQTKRCQRNTSFYYYNYSDDRIVISASSNTFTPYEYPGRYL